MMRKSWPNKRTNFYKKNQWKENARINSDRRQGQFTLGILSHANEHNFFSVKGVLEDYHQYQNYEPKKEQPDRESLDSDLSLSDDDDEAFQRYREARLKEMERRHSKATAPVKSDLVEELNLDTYVKVAENAGHGA